MGYLGFRSSQVHPHNKGLLVKTRGILGLCFTGMVLGQNLREDPLLVSGESLHIASRRIPFTAKSIRDFVSLKLSYDQIKVEEV